MSKTVGFIVGGVALVGVAFAALTLTDVDVNDAGELPSVDIETEGGELPEVDVDVADIDVRMEDANVKVPDVDIEMEEKKIPVPKIDIDQPDATSDEKERSPELNEGEGETDTDSEPQ
ncbi:MAG: hypothetical protein AAGD92_06645 [Pseudomonadota bacterium]